MYGNYLQHHGIKGQKWGVRRYQNEDGSLTAAGKKRYADESKNFSKMTKDFYNTQGLYNEVEERASAEFKKRERKLIRIANKFNIPVIADTSGETGDRIWAASYRSAVDSIEKDGLFDGQFSADDMLAISKIYDLLYQSGTTDYFFVDVLYNNGKPKIALTHMDTGKVFYNFNSANDYHKKYIAMHKTRQKNIQGKPVSIKVDKTKKVSGGPSGLNPGVGSAIKEAGKEKRLKNAVAKVGSVSIKTLKNKKKS